MRRLAQYRVGVTHLLSMRALAIEGHGLENLGLIQVDDPIPGPGEVIVSLRAAALNHLDVWTLHGIAHVEPSFPHTLGADGAGLIETIGEGVTGMRPGTRVLINPALSCGACEFCRAGEQSLCTTFRMLGEHVSGTLAERVKIPAGNVFPVPEHLSMTEAAALGVTFITAYRMLFTRGRLQPGEWVLVTGIGGGLAISALQLARPVAGRVYVTSSSEEKIHRALELGADGGVNYSEQDVGKSVRALTAKRGVDVVIDSAGGAALDSATRALRKGGRLVNAGGTAGAMAEINVGRLFWNQLEVIGSTMGSNSDVANMLRMVAGTKLRPIIDKVFSFDEAAEAVKYLESQEQFGKVVVSFEPD
jgi:NADPH:quinone reductase-like Zn-dependent oxidoreductase